MKIFLTLFVHAVEQKQSCNVLRADSVKTVEKLNMISQSRVTLRAYSVKAAVIEVPLAMAEKHSCHVLHDDNVKAVLMRTSRVRT